MVGIIRVAASCLAATLCLSACATNHNGKIKVCEKVKVTGQRLPHTECRWEDAPEATASNAEPKLDTQ
ncbi:MAG: hypothetical protein AAFN74_20235 [Myxococcota bacterium]